MELMSDIVPSQGQSRGINSISTGNSKAFGAILNISTGPISKLKRKSARTILMLEEVYSLFRAVLVLEPLIDAVLAALKTASFPQGTVNVGLRDEKGGGLFILRLLDLSDLLLLRWEQA